MFKFGDFFKVKINIIFVLLVEMLGSLCMENFWINIKGYLNEKLYCYGLVLRRERKIEEIIYFLELL